MTRAPVFSGIVSQPALLACLTEPVAAHRFVGSLSHALFGVFFTATSIIGCIALAGIIVRNSILLVDFVNLELAAGEPLEEAVVKAGAVRFRRSS